MTTTPTPWSDEIVFDTNPEGFEPRITVLKDNSFILAWDTATGIAGKHLNSFGSFTAGDFFRDISTANTAVGTPLVIQRADGSVGVDYNQFITATNSDVVSVRVNADFDSTTPPFPLDSTAEDTLLEDSVAHGETGAGDPAGGALAIRHARSTGFTNLELQFTSLNGSYVGNPLLIDSSTARSEDDAALAGLDTGDVVIAYDSIDNKADDRDVRLKIFSPQGSQVNDDIIVSANDKLAAFPDLTQIGHGNIVVTWQETDGIAFRRYSSSGFALEDAPIFVPNSAGALTPKVTSLNDGGFIIAYAKADGVESDGSGNFDLFLQRYDDVGNKVGDAVHVAEPGDQVFGLNIATLSDGRVVVSYVGETGDATGVTTLNYRIFDPRDATITGDAENNNIVGRLDSSMIHGLDGADQLTGMNAADKLFGDSGDDVLLGQGGADLMSGGGGNDHLDGGADDDNLRGNAGRDMLTGGAGADTFFFKLPSDSTVAASGRDTIMDFTHGQHDKIDVHFIDADSRRGGNQRFDFIGDDHFHHVAGELRTTGNHGETFVTGDVDGDGRADFSIELHGGLHLVQGDFDL
jgi:Ca2+-binding RTX toxin-like protein